VKEPVGPRIAPIGERALLVTLGDRLDLAVNASARRLAATVEAHRLADPRFGRPVPAAVSVLIPFDPLSITSADAAGIVAELAAASRAASFQEMDAGTAAGRPPVEIRVSYGGADGPDLTAVAEAHALRPDDVVELHAGSIWTALFLGFAPGFAYLGPLPPKLATPRRATPRERVQAGSVAIGGDQTAVYPFAMPGGWQIIGRTEQPMWDVRRQRPNLLRPGDLVRFVPVR
jgi:inhibitor of KinA